MRDSYLAAHFIWSLANDRVEDKQIDKMPRATYGQRPKLSRQSIFPGSLPVIIDKPEKI
jgi:hypothetical protein